MRILYTLLIHLYGIGISVAALFSVKAKAWISGRRDLFASLQKVIDTRQQWIWFHAASLGEFEQGRPLIERIRQAYPDYGILLTFFSPSGYEVRKNYPLADFVTYMSLDTPRNAATFVRIVNPSAAIFIKYEIWYNHITELQRSGIPTFLISANLRKDQFYFTVFGTFIGDRLRRFTQIFTQSESSAAMLVQKGFTNVMHAGDTRVDRVMEIANAPKDFSWLKSHLASGPILVAGSTWPADEARLFPAIMKAEIQCIIAPHEVNASRLKSIEEQLPNAKRLSVLKDAVSQNETHIIIVDTIGDLAHLYALADIAYVGGGFGSGIHNILEPAAHGIPVLFGPRYQKFIEAHDLIRSDAAKSIESSEQISSALQHFLQPTQRDAVRQTIDVYLSKQRGATDRIQSFLKEYL